MLSLLRLLIGHDFLPQCKVDGEAESQTVNHQKDPAMLNGPTRARKAAIRPVGTS